MNDKKTLRGHLFTILCVIAWGTSFLVSKSLMEKMRVNLLSMVTNRSPYFKRDPKKAYRAEE